MYIFGEFENQSATVNVTVRRATDDVAVVTGAPTVHVGGGLYKYNFNARVSTIDYYVIFTNVEDATTAGGAIPADAVVDMSALATQASIDALNNLSVADVESSNLAKEATLNSKASQASVDSIPTNPLLSADSRLDHLDADISSRLSTAGYTVPSNLSAADVWSHASRALTDTTGFELSSAQVDAIAVAVEASILNEGDGQAVLNAIVGALGNTNVDELSLVAAIRADIEREGGLAKITNDKVLTLDNADLSAVATTTDVENARDAVNANVDGLNNFDPTSDIVANVALVDTVTTNTDMRGTDGANTIAPDNQGISDVQVDVAALPTKADLVVVNNNVKKASLLIPASEDI